MPKNVDLPSDEKATLLLNAVEDRKAVEPSLLDLRDKTVMTDFFLICSGTSDTHIRAISDLVMERADEAHLPTPREMGRSVGEWILLDFGDVIVHVMSEEARERYNLEKFWTTPQPKGALPPTPDSVGLDDEDAEAAAWAADTMDEEDDDDEDAAFFEIADEELEPLEDEDLDLDDAETRAPSANTTNAIHGANGK